MMNMTEGDTVSDLHYINFQQVCNSLIKAWELVDSYKLGAKRYEIARRMNPRQWKDAWELNISTGKPFDQIIDELGPFYGIK